MTQTHFHSEIHEHSNQCPCVGFLIKPITRLIEYFTCKRNSYTRSPSLTASCRRVIQVHSFRSRASQHARGCELHRFWILDRCFAPVVQPFLRQMLGDEKLWRTRLRADWTVWDANDLVRKAGGGAKSVYLELLRIRGIRYKSNSEKNKQLVSSEYVFQEMSLQCCIFCRLPVGRAGIASHLASACIDGFDRISASMPRQSAHLPTWHRNAHWPHHLMTVAHHLVAMRAMTLFAGGCASSAPPRRQFCALSYPRSFLPLW